MEESFVSSCGLPRLGHEAISRYIAQVLEDGSYCKLAYIVVLAAVPHLEDQCCEAMPKEAVFQMSRHIFRIGGVCEIGYNINIFNNK